jgi:hypothetical protein
VFGASQLRTGSGTSADAFTSVTVLDDAGGDLLVAGTLGITASNLEAYLSRRTSAGATVWEELYAGPTTGVEGARAYVVGDDGWLAELVP